MLDFWGVCHPSPLLNLEHLFQKRQLCGFFLVDFWKIPGKFETGQAKKLGSNQQQQPKDKTDQKGFFWHFFVSKSFRKKNGCVKTRTFWGKQKPQSTTGVELCTLKKHERAGFGKPPAVSGDFLEDGPRADWSLQDGVHSPRKKWPKLSKSGYFTPFFNGVISILWDP